jgi:hypothetical protein
MVATLPPSCGTVVIGGATYEQCGPSADFAAQREPCGSRVTIRKDTDTRRNAPVGLLKPRLRRIELSGSTIF